MVAQPVGVPVTFSVAELTLQLTIDCSDRWDISLSSVLILTF